MNISKLLPFTIEKFNYYLKCPKPNSVGIEELVESGIMIFPNLFNDATVKQIQARASDLLSVDPNVWRIPHFQTIVPESKQIFENFTIAEIVTKFLGREFVCSRKIFCNKTEENSAKEGPTEAFHFDDWKHRLKMMYFVNDVGPNNGPFCYLKGSQTWSVWKHSEELKFYRSFDRSQPEGLGNNDWSGSYDDKTAEKIKVKRGYEEVQVTGPAGTAIVFDSRGLHRGLPLGKDASRQVLIQHWKLPGGDGEKRAGTEAHIFDEPA